MHCRSSEFAGGSEYPNLGIRHLNSVRRSFYFPSLADPGARLEGGYRYAVLPAFAVTPYGAAWIAIRIGHSFAEFSVDTP